MKRSKTVAAFLALFGGFIGAHKFYLRDFGGGIFYMFLLFTVVSAFNFPITAILGFFEAFRLFTMSEDQFNRTYNKAEYRRQQQRSNDPRNRRRQGNRQSNRQERDMVRERRRGQNQRIVKKQRSNPFIKSGNTKFKDYDLEGALEDFEKALEISPDNYSLHFNMASVYSLLEKKDNSYYHIEQALDLGFKDTDKIMSKDDFAFLRVQNDFDSFKDNGFKRVRGKTIEPPKDDLLQDDVLLSQLNKLKDLRSRGLLSQKEFVYEKEKLLRK